ncbi:hypothetical protein CHLRE_06g281650v5 [Chlamydomonas reinhardtii]|uniref:Uncharacterized protein n=1 Tax=Chlamydomonas reinhardtii TaxID=3055 RepID=A0A2K3DPN7_CHLRE|nr:uncharacterized protein CHLRE_06g281650v5 [Chlamydomonas reinhardtii]PNW82506.1 hypothetical protein CHLRE_06g281650v5 [Chlamydomonas reinhardtii]
MTMGSSATIADVLGGVLALAYTVISVPCVVFSPMIFDAPGSSKNTLTRLLFVTVLPAPICGCVSMFLAVSRIMFLQLIPGTSAAPPASFGLELLLVLTPVLVQLAALASAIVLLQVLQGGSFSVPDRQSKAPGSSTSVGGGNALDDKA